MNLLKKLLSIKNNKHDTSPEYNAFLTTDLSKYKKGEYIIFTEEGVYSHGYDIKELVKEFKNDCPEKVPAIFKVPPKTFVY